ncbi:MAG: SLBB domain-containing protein [Gemmatimonadaceae bacterium]|nr:SLBB domain-containing protein [Gemmatimonadaceae bacterium]MCW5825414.1 SLBB domain-containing protein [Gemmatimonadaceae bacterium]
MKLNRILTVCVAALLTVLPLRSYGQAPTGEQIRSRIQASGLTPDQIRDRLASAGYSRTLLDGYLGSVGGAAPAPSQDILDALSKLSPEAVRAQGVTDVPVESGLESRPRPRDDGVVDGVKIFGLDVFRARSSQFQPLLAGPVPDSYRLGAGDLMVLVVSGDVELVHNLEVTRDGFVLIPQVGQIYVSSMTMAQVKQTLRTRLGAAYSGIRTGSTQFDLTLARLRTNQVFVIGEVVQPGAYQLASVATVLNALYAAGGPTERGSMRQVRVERQGRTIAVFDLYDYLLRGDTKSDLMLEMGDVVFVPVHGVRAALQGAVIRPAIYELASEQTLTDLVDAAGGFSPEAALRRISISRILPADRRVPGAPDRVILDVPVEQVAGGRAPAVPIAPGDEVHVFEVSTSRRAIVELKGAVYQPGTFGWRPGLRISEVVKLAGGVKPAVLADMAHIERLNQADSTRYLIRIGVPADSTQPWPNDVVLEEYDVVTIFGRENLRQNRTVHISGLVDAPGTFEYTEGMTVRDLILMAGGLLDGALLDTVEVARLPLNRNSGQLARIYRFPLDSTYLFEPKGTSFRFLPGPPARAAGATEIVLEPFDRVTVFRQPEFELQRTVLVEGEVVFPGTFSLLSKTERLSSVIRRAGGLSPTAYARGAQLVRAAEDAGAVDLNLEAALREPGGRSDPILKPGDVVRVPEYNVVVKVRGGVIDPVSVQFRPGARLSYYIRVAGGYSRSADRSRVSIRYANGSADVRRRQLLLFRVDPEVQPGALITVGVKPDAEPLNTTAFLASLAQILASTATIIVIMNR